MNTEKIKSLVSQNKIEEAIQLLLKQHRDRTISQELVLLQSRLVGLNSKSIKGIISDSDKILEENKISSSLLDILMKIEFPSSIKIEKNSNETHLNDFNVEIIKQNRVKPQNVRILNFQLLCDISEWNKTEGLFYNSVTTELKKKVKKIISIAKSRTVDVIVLPELSIPLNLMEVFQAWSRDTSGIAIVGSHYFNNGGRTISRAPIIINGEIFFTEKLNPAPIEKSPIQGMGLTPGNHIHFFQNTSIGNFSVLICADFLEPSTRKRISSLPNDFIFVIAFQKDSNLYHQRMDIECQESEFGIYTIYSNLYSKGFSDGRSAFFGQLDKIFFDQLIEHKITNGLPKTKIYEIEEEESYYIVDVDIISKKPTFPRNVTTKPNIEIVESGKLSNVSSEGFVEKIPHKDERYRKIDDLFVPPSEFNEISRKLEELKIVFIIGDPGIGKTYTAAFLLNQYFKQGYTPVWYVGLEKEERKEQIDILENFEPQNKQIIYFEDPFGRVTFERRELIYSVFSQLYDKIKYIDTRIVITSRKEIFEQFSKESFNVKELDIFKEEMNIVNPSYSAEDLFLILKKIAFSRCTWYKNDECIELIKEVIRTKKIVTPLAIRNLVFTSMGVDNVDDLRQIVSRRENEIAKSFAHELKIVDDSTKIFLQLILLFGFNNQSLLSDIYNNIFNFYINNYRQFLSKSFKEVLREELGFRVEQLGLRRAGLKITHPAYEEAITILCQTDNNYKNILKIILNDLLRTDFDLLLRGSSRQIIIYPDFSILIYRLIIDHLKGLKEDRKKYYLATRLIAGYDYSKNTDFLNLLTELINLDNLIIKLNAENNLYILTYQLRIAYNIIIRTGNIEHQSIAKRIDWDKLIDKIIMSTKYSWIPACLSWMKIFDIDIIENYIAKAPENHSKNLVIFSNINERRFLRNLFNDTTFVKKIKRLISKTPIERSYKGKRKLLFENYDTRNFIKIDRGAEKAMKAYWNLLPPGILQVGGYFYPGEVVGIMNEKDKIIGRGMAQYSSEEVELIKGFHSSNIPEILGRFNGVAILKNSKTIIFRKKTKTKTKK